MNIAIIPARGGSKRIPRKNIREFCGKPMIAWSIEAAKTASIFDRIIVSTDDAEIADIAKQYGAEIPFIRSASLSDDLTSITEIIAHGTKWAIEQGMKIQSVCCIYATAPFIKPSDLVGAFTTLNSGKWLYAFAATEYASPIFRSFEKSSNGGVQMLYPEFYRTRSQDLPVIFHDAGQFCWGRAQAWLDHERVFSSTSYPFIIPSWRVIDIDTPDDWVRAEHMFAAMNSVDI